MSEGIDASTKAGAGLSAELQAALRYWGARIRQARAEAFVTREQLAASVGLSVKTLQRMEAGAAEIAIGHYLAVGDKLRVPMLVQPTLIEMMAHPIKPNARSRRPRNLF